MKTKKMPVAKVALFFAVSPSVPQEILPEAHPYWRSTSITRWTKTKRQKQPAAPNNKKSYQTQTFSIEAKAMGRDSPVRRFAVNFEEVLPNSKGRQMKTQFTKPVHQ